MSTLIYNSVRVGDIEVVALSRNGGVSVGNFESLNVANYVGDSSEAVAENISRATSVVKASGASVMQGEHGNKVHRVTQPGYAKPGDGLVTNVPGLALLALAADCVPFALVDPVARVIAVGHAGWKGVSVNVMQSVSDEFLAIGGNPTQSTAVIGPSICGECYEVSPERVAELKAVAPEAILNERHIAVAKGVVAELSRQGFSINQMPGCNFEDDLLFSYRRAAGAPTGRGGIIVALPTS